MRTLCLKLLLLLVTSTYGYYNVFKTTSLKRQTIRKAKNQKSIEKAQAYIRMRDFKRLQKEGANTEEIKEFLQNGTMRSVAGSSNRDTQQKGYQQYVGKKGNLEARLRAVIAYKRESISSQEVGEGELSKREESELEAMMNDDSDDDDELEENEEEYVDDEEAEYESLVISAIEANKLKELQRNFLIDTNARNDDNSSKLLSLPEDEVKYDATTGEELYTPARSSWGVFQRPKDISKRFGGGRVITKAEMDKMDRDSEENERKSKLQNQIAMASIAKSEKESNDKLKSALLKSRNHMRMGDRKAAVKTLEDVQQLASFQTDLGGELKLEYAMALETVDKFDEAREIYATLVIQSWSQKIKGNAIGLLQGLEITRQIRKDNTPAKPFMDSYSMQKISDALKPGLRNEWDEYSSKKYTKVTPWYDTKDSNSGGNTEITKVESLQDAHKVFLNALNPLKKIPSTVLNDAFSAMVDAPETEKVTLLRSRGVVVAPKVIKSKIPVYAMQFSLFNQTKTDGPNTDDGFNSAISKMTGGLNPPAIDEDSSPSFQIFSKSKTPENKKYEYDPTLGTNTIYLECVNGTWDLILSLNTKNNNFMSKNIPQSRRYDYGEIRRTMITEGRSNCKAEEIFPVLFGLTTIKITHDLKLNPERSEIVFTGSRIAESNAPWQKRRQSSQALELLYCDDIMKLTKQSTDNGKSYLYTLWKRVLPTIWKKY